MGQFDPKAGKGITSAEAAEKIGKYERQRAPGQTRATYFNKAVIEKLLSKKGAVGMWVIYAEDANGQLTSVLAASDVKGHVINTGNELSGEKESLDDPNYVNDGGNCPENCPEGHGPESSSAFI